MSSRYWWLTRAKTIFFPITLRTGIWDLNYFRLVKKNGEYSNNGEQFGYIFDHMCICIRTRKLIKYKFYSTQTEATNTRICQESVSMCYSLSFLILDFLNIVVLQSRFIGNGVVLRWARPPSWQIWQTAFQDFAKN